MDEIVTKAREILTTLAPEIPGEELTWEADLKADLGLDDVSIFVLATGLEREMGRQIPDTQICAAHTLADLSQGLIPPDATI